jgi:hypothetical protein
MCYQEPCVKCFHCRKCVVICANELDSVTYDFDLPPNTTISIDPPMQSIQVKRDMSDNDAFNLMDNIRDELWK